MLCPRQLFACYSSPESPALLYSQVTSCADGVFIAKYRVGKATVAAHHMVLARSRKRSWDESLSPIHHHSGRPWHTFCSRAYLWRRGGVESSLNSSTFQIRIPLYDAHLISCRWSSELSQACGPSPKSLYRRFQFAEPAPQTNSACCSSPIFWADCVF